MCHKKRFILTMISKLTDIVPFHRRFSQCEFQTIRNTFAQDVSSLNRLDCVAASL